jgi:hypothetical protein
MEIKPINLEEAKVIVHKLAFSWSQADLSSEHMIYVNFSQPIDRLLTATGTPMATAYILAGVINQACALGKTPQWVEGELGFEAQAAAFGNRPGLLVSELDLLEVVTDDSLDLYNERLTRFANG